MTEKNDENETTTVLQRDILEISQEWLVGLMNEVKRTMMTVALESRCNKQFLSNLNAMQLNFGEDQKIAVGFKEERLLGFTGLHQSTVSSDMMVEEDDDEAAIATQPTVH